MEETKRVAQNQVIIKNAIQRLDFLCTHIPPLLLQIDDQAFSMRPSQGKWSAKEIIGHLIDSACNNHQRFVRAQFETEPLIVYNADLWNAHGHYSKIAGEQVIAFWTSYNKQLLALIQNIPVSAIDNHLNTGEDKPRSLAFVIGDYVAHMEHHLKQVLEY